MGFRSPVARSTLADANESRDWRIYADFAQTLTAIARPLYAQDPIGVELNQSLYALDSTTIDLCLSLFPWAKFRQHKAAVKMHTLLDLHGNIPSFIRITDGKTSDVNSLDEFLPETGSFYVMDRGYIDFACLFVFTLCSAFLVVRTKENVLLERRYSQPVDKSYWCPFVPHRRPNHRRIGESLSRSFPTGHLLRPREPTPIEVPH
jgi:Transposase DDE domain